MRYRILADGAVLELALTGSPAERRRLSEVLRDLAMNPAGPDDKEMRAASGQIYKVRLLQGFRVVYGTDHLRREVEIVDVEPAAPLWRA